MNKYYIIIATAGVILQLIKLIKSINFKFKFKIRLKK